MSPTKTIIAALAVLTLIPALGRGRARGAAGEPPR